VPTMYTLFARKSTPGAITTVIHEPGHDPA